MEFILEYLHYIIIGIIIILIVFLQGKVYKSTINKLDIYKDIFPHNYSSWNVEIDEENGNVIGISSKHKNFILNTIIHSINKYLQNNKGSISDFHLMRDIVDRNTETSEEEIHAQIPVPLYYGLMGTMAGIIVGVGILVISGGLKELLDSTTSSNGSKGIEALLSGVALAMISSIIGILLTVIGSKSVRVCKVKVDLNKNLFLSWIHAELLPELSTDMSSAFEKMTKNLSSFNSTFSSNTRELKSTLALVNESYKGQAELLQSINKLKIREIAYANINVYDKLKNCTDEIGYFGTYLHNVNEYISNVRKLNDKLDLNETRTKAIEDMGTFFKEERANMQAWNGVVVKSVGEVDENLRQVVENLKINVTEQFRKLIEHTDNQRQDYEKVIDEQNRFLKAKTKEIEIVIDELKNLTSVKSSLQNLERATLDHNRKIDKLADSIKMLANTKTGLPAKSNQEIPKWIKISALAGGGFLVVTSLFFVVVQLLYILGVL